VEGQVDRLVEDVEELESKRAEVVDKLVIEVAKVITLAIKGTSEVKTKTPLMTTSMKMIGMLTWEKAVQEISGYGDNHKVTYSARSLTGRALTWWNSKVRTRGRKAVVGMTWEDFKELIKEEYYPSNEMQKLEMDLWNHVMVGAGY
nr:reverse transcriptase domain-containing protein [Tanacetum cinerariifolium]